MSNLRQPFFLISFIAYAIGWLFMFIGLCVLGVFGITWFMMFLDLATGIALAMSINSGTFETNKLALLSFIVIVTVNWIGWMAALGGPGAGSILIGLGALIRVIVNFGFIIEFGSAGARVAVSFGRGGGGNAQAASPSSTKAPV